MSAALRPPIISLLGHVDHGKTTLLDRIAGSIRAEREAGGITQHIGAIEVPLATVHKLSHGIVETKGFQVPGLLFIDTPGHRSFETMRRRGGALADLAILVVDIKEGFMPQTRESVQILRHEKTPFVVALTKIDLVPGWRKPTGQVALAEQLKRCGPEYVRALDERTYSVAEQLDQMGFSADRYDRVSDFSRNVGLSPVSAKSGVGLAELLALLVGLAQRFLKSELKVVTGGGEATILERSDQKGLGPVGNVIVYRGRLKVGDEVIANGRREPFATKIRGLYRPAPPTRGAAGKTVRLVSLDEVEAAAGVYLSAPGIEEAMPGGLLKVVADAKDREAVFEALRSESQPVADLAESGVAIAADTLGGLEALAFECRNEKLPIHSAEVGPVGRPSVVRQADVKDPTHRAVLAFQVPILDDALSESETAGVKVFRGDVMYRILEEYLAWRTERTAALDTQRRLETVHPAKIRILPGFIFRASKPAIVGVKVVSGTLRAGVRVMNAKGEEVGLVKALQQDGSSVPRAEEGSELAVSIDGAVVHRNIEEGDVLFVLITEGTARALRAASLTESERAVLEDVIRIRRQTAPFWGQ
ncbi:MAG TPA: translation initiation factor IF-2 [Thermoplasmata archaeon]|nr:translation initiation factor IF-2 [Thermoplasmata archaeon]